MHIAVLAASGATGHQLASQALKRGHTVTAIARHPETLDLPKSDRLIPVRGDVRDDSSIARAVASVDVIVSALGAVRGDASGILLIGARALVQAGPPRILWLGAFGTGRSASAAGPLTRSILRLALRSELSDKVAADNEILAAGGTVFHAGPLSNTPLAIGHTIVPLEHVPRRLIPQPISRPTVAALMLNEAESPNNSGQLVVPLRTSRPVR